MKYWRGYICAAVFAALTIALSAFAESHTKLIDMVYPYASRLIQTSLAQWSGNVDFCLWQLLAIVLIVLALASLVAMVILRWNFFQWLGWVAAVCSFVFMLHTGVYGLNYNAGPISEDIRLEEADFTVTELAEATSYYLEIANELSTQVPRNPDGSLNFPSFSELADMAGEGFQTLTNEEFLAVFAGSTLPVKELGWADMYTSMGITGFTMPLTGEAAVNPQTPAAALPFTMCHEMSHRMCIAVEQDANMAAFLACDAHSDPIFRYSAYFMAFRYCYNALASTGTSASWAAASQIYEKVCPELKKDLDDHKAFYAQNMDADASQLADSVNDTYLKISGDENGTASYDKVADLLVSWYIQEIYLPAHQEEVIPFDPTDRNQVDLREGLTVEGKE